jgi:hypothetical protein
MTKHDDGGPALPLLTKLRGLLADDPRLTDLIGALAASASECAVWRHIAGNYICSAADMELEPDIIEARARTDAELAKLEGMG